MSRTVYVEAEVELDEIDKHDLACELVERLGKDAALSFVAAVKVEDGRRSASHPLDGKDPEKEMRREIRAAILLIERGKADEGMRALRILGAEETSIIAWQAIKDGKHPFLRLPQKIDA